MLAGGKGGRVHLDVRILPLMWSSIPLSLFPMPQKIDFRQPTDPGPDGTSLVAA